MTIWIDHYKIVKDPRKNKSTNMCVNWERKDIRSEVRTELDSTFERFKE